MYVARQLKPRSQMATAIYRRKVTPAHVDTLHARSKVQRERLLDNALQIAHIYTLINDLIHILFRVHGEKRASGEKFPNERVGLEVCF